MERAELRAGGAGRQTSRQLRVRPLEVRTDHLRLVRWGVRAQGQVRPGARRFDGAAHLLSVLPPVVVPGLPVLLPGALGPQRSGHRHHCHWGVRGGRWRRVPVWEAAGGGHGRPEVPAQTQELRSPKETAVQDLLDGGASGGRVRRRVGAARQVDHRSDVEAHQLLLDRAGVAELRAGVRLHPADRRCIVTECLDRKVDL